MKFMIVGSGGRECAFARHLATETALYAILSHENPDIVDYVMRSGGSYMVGNVCDPQAVLSFARQHDIDYVFVNADDPLANGVTDILLENDIKAIGGTRAATRVEWDKVYAIEMMKALCPEFTPYFRVISDKTELDDAIQDFASKHLDIVVKPQGLTGGKGVKVMPIHLATYQDCAKYAATLLQEKPQEQVLLVEKLHGPEFTIMGWTDGERLVLSPASYDYPYRYDGDRGAGTGGMGCFTGTENQLPFMTASDLADCERIMQTVIDELRKRKLHFTGILNGGFFKTPSGIKFMEFNSRFGDPEALNILSLLNSSFSRLLISLWERTLSADKVKFSRKASVVKYLVAPEYPEASAKTTMFKINRTAIEDMGAQVILASCVKQGNEYETLKKSRVAAICGTADTIIAAAKLVNDAIDRHVAGGLEYRRDIGSKENIEKLTRNNSP